MYAKGYKGHRGKIRGGREVREEDKGIRKGKVYENDIGYMICGILMLMYDI